MRKKAIILDLDNTIYPVSAIGDKLFGPLFTLIKKSGEYDGDLDAIKHQIMRQPFQVVAKDFSFSEALKAKCLALLADLTYEDKIDPFGGYEVLRSLPQQKYLVTTGFSKLQHSKIKQLGISKDFDAVFVVDPSTSDLTKKDIFTQILADHHYKPEDVLVVGDDLDSEIKAAKELGIDAVLYNYDAAQPEAKNQKSIHTFRDMARFLN